MAALRAFMLVSRSSAKAGGGGEASWANVLGGGIPERGLVPYTAEAVLALRVRYAMGGGVMLASKTHHIFVGVVHDSRPKSKKEGWQESERQQNMLCRCSRPKTTDNLARVVWGRLVVVKP